MEVHHPHHPPKSLKDYASEFIVIFVALTLGFLVENQREHYIEGLREKELAKSLLKDLAADSVDFKEFQELRIIERKSVNQAIKILENLYHLYNLWQKEKQREPVSSVKSVGKNPPAKKYLYVINVTVGF